MTYSQSSKNWMRKTDATWQPQKWNSDFKKHKPGTGSWVTPGPDPQNKNHDSQQTTHRTSPGRTARPRRMAETGRDDNDHLKTQIPPRRCRFFMRNQAERHVHRQPAAGYLPPGSWERLDGASAKHWRTKTEGI